MVSCPEVPPEVVGQILWAVVLLPRALQLKRVGIHQEDAAGTVAAGRTERAAIDAVGATMNGVWRCVARLFNELFRLDHLHDLGMIGVRFRIQDVNPGRPDARHDQVTTLHVRVRGLRAEARAARVPAEVMQLIIAVGKIHLADELTIRGGARIDVNDAHGVALPILADVEQSDVSDVFRRGLHRHARRGVKGWIRHQGHIHILLWQRVTAKDLPRPMFHTA